MALLRQSAELARAKAELAALTGELAKAKNQNAQGKRLLLLTAWMHYASKQSRDVRFVTGNALTLQIAVRTSSIKK